MSNNVYTEYTLRIELNFCADSTQLMRVHFFRHSPSTLLMDFTVWASNKCNWQIKIVHCVSECVEFGDTFFHSRNFIEMKKVGVTSIFNHFWNSAIECIKWLFGKCVVLSFSPFLLSTSSLEPIYIYFEIKWQLNWLSLMKWNMMPWTGSNRRRMKETKN